MKVYTHIHQADELCDLLSDTNYNPFQVSRALEALTHNKPVIQLENCYRLLVPMNDNNNRNRLFRKAA